MQLRHSSPKAWWAVYVVWVAFCVALFFALRGAEDPSRLRGRIPQEAAAATALQFLSHSDAAHFQGYEVVNAALYKNKRSMDPIWVVLCGSPQRKSLADAIVVEVDAVTGAVVGMRAPGGQAVNAPSAATVPAGGVR